MTITVTRIEQYGLAIKSEWVRCLSSFVMDVSLSCLSIVLSCKTRTKCRRMIDKQNTLYFIVGHWQIPSSQSFIGIRREYHSCERLHKVDNKNKRDLFVLLSNFIFPFSNSYSNAMEMEIMLFKQRIF